MSSKCRSAGVSVAGALERKAGRAVGGGTAEVQAQRQAHNLDNKNQRWTPFSV